MVILVYKKTEKNSFAIECTLETKVSVIIAQLVQLNNLRVYLDRLIWSVEQLANKGVLKPPQLQGVSWDDFDKHQNEFTHLPPQALEYGRKPIVEPPQRYVPDKHNQRYGVIFPVQTQQILLKAVQSGKKTLEFQPAILASKQSLIESVQVIRQAVMEVYPAYIDLPEWEPTLLMLEEKVDLQILETDNFQVFDERGTLWWAGKELQKNKAIGQYIGKNQKSKAVVKVQKWGGQQPMREPPVDAQTYKTMVKYYYKKVDQAKEIQKNSVQSHYEKIETSDMKSKVHLSEQIRYKPF